MKSSRFYWKTNIFLKANNKSKSIFASLLVLWFGVFNFIFIFTKTATKLQGRKRDHHFISYAAGVIDPVSSVLAGGYYRSSFFKELE